MRCLNPENFHLNGKKAYVHFIPKPNKNYVRPISLTSYVSKLFETMVKNRMNWWVEHENVLPNSQTGFRTGQSRLNNLSNLLLQAEDSFRKCFVKMVV